MKVKNNTSSDHKREIQGLSFLSVGIFLALCLISYHASDPSFNSFGHARTVQNLGGVIGSYTAGLLVTLFGYGAYCLLLSFLILAFGALASKTGFFTWSRQAAFLIFVLLTSIFLHLRFNELTMGGIPQDAGGVLGWFFGGLSRRYFGNIGSYLLVSSGLLLTFLWGTSIQASRMAAFFVRLALFLKDRFISFATLFSVRFGKMLGRWYGALQEAWEAWRERQAKAKQKQRRDPKVVREPNAALPPDFVKAPAHAEPPESVLTQTVPVETVQAAETPKEPVSPVNEEAEVGGKDGPVILPRADAELKMKKPMQMEIISPNGKYNFPPLSLLNSEENNVVVDVDEESLKLNSRLLEKKLMDYGVEGHVTEIHPGPIVTMYEFEPAPGVKVSKIVNLEDDLSLTMGGKSVRIVAPLPGKPAVGIEIPNNERETVWLKDVIGHSKFQRHESRIALALGKDIEGIPYVSNLAKMPHLLIAGATGSGKSVSVNTLILSILYKASPVDVKFILIDLKMLELAIYEDIPHLLLPVVKSPKKAAMALRWAVEEMERRYELLSSKAVRNLQGYNKIVPEEEKLPTLVIIIDELADLMMTSANDVERYITRLAQMARAAGIHLVLATQRPSVDVITGLIKANFPSRISFKVASKHDSRTILDACGSEHLLGYGDMLFMAPGSSKLLRVHGAYVTEVEIERVVAHLKTQGIPHYDETILQPRPEDLEAAEGAEGAGGEDPDDQLYDEAVAIVTQTKQASISMIQRKLRIGYNRAARLVEKMEAQGVVGPADGSKPREVYATHLTD